MKRLTLLQTGSVIAAILISLPAYAQTAGKPAETKRANAPAQKPAFTGQTRAPQPAELVDIKAEVVADDLPHLWAWNSCPTAACL